MLGESGCGTRRESNDECLCWYWRSFRCGLSHWDPEKAPVAKYGQSRQERPCCFHLQGGAIVQVENRRTGRSSSYLLVGWFDYLIRVVRFVDSISWLISLLEQIGLVSWFIWLVNSVTWLDRFDRLIQSFGWLVGSFDYLFRLVRLVDWLVGWFVRWVNLLADPFIIHSAGCSVSLVLVASIGRFSY
jgi:hypothetical protein